MTKQEFIHCALCGVIVKESESHNAEPLCEGRCCSKCNAERVLPERLKDLFGVQSETRQDAYIKASSRNGKSTCEMHGSADEIVGMLACCMDGFAKRFGEKALVALTATVLANRKEEANV